jgi:hypothetical protein
VAAPKLLADMLAELKAKVASPERKEVLAALATDLAQLSSRALLGEDVSAELQHVKSQGESLAASESELVRSAFLDWAELIVGTVVRGALAGL